MKKTLLLIFFVLFGAHLYCQQINWVRSISRLGFTIKATTDPSSNLYLFGYTQTYYADPAEGSIIRKYNPDGISLFELELNGKIFIKDMLNDGEGNFYFCGSFRETVSSNGISLKSEGRNDAFLGKMNEQGEISWAFGFGGSKDDVASSITFNADSSEIILTGGVDSTVYMHDYPIITTKKAILLASFDFEGALLRYKTYAFATSEYGKNIGLEIETNNNGYFLYADRMGDHWNNPAPTGGPVAGRYLFNIDMDFNISWSKYVISEACYYGYSSENISSFRGDAYVPSFCSSKYGGTGKLQQFEAESGNVSWSINNHDGTYYDTEASGNRMYYVGNEEVNGCPCQDNNPGNAKVKMLDENNADQVLLEKYGFHFYNVTIAQNGNIYVYGRTGGKDPELGGHVLEPGYFILSIQGPDAGNKAVDQETLFLTVFPNPSNGNLQVISQGHIDELSVTDMNGTQVMRAFPDSKACKLEGLNAGCYAVRVRTGNSFAVSKLVVAE